MNRSRGSAALLAIGLSVSPWAMGAAPDWLRAQVGATLPSYDETTAAIVMHADTTLTVLPNGTMKRRERIAYKILRPAGGNLGTVHVHYDEQSRITFMRAWSIPANGKDYEVKEKDAAETALFGVQDGSLVSDLRTKMMRIPAAVPGSIIGYEYEQEVRPYMRLDEWDFQSVFPVREAQYSLQLPAGWTPKFTWLNYEEQQPTTPAVGKWQWTLTNLKAVKIEEQMPPWQGIASRMVVSILPPDGRESGMQSWRDIGLWYNKLVQDRRTSTPQIKQQVADLTAAATAPMQRMSALADFVQSNIRYVAVELGIGGYQPHRATDIYANRFGDCKDKATLLSVMLKEVGIESYYVIINTERGSITETTPPNLGFNHAILAIALPPGLEDESLLAVVPHPKLGRLLFFDPTDQTTPFGRVSGELQANHGLLMAPDGGELLAVPKFAPEKNSVERRAQLKLDESGTLSGDFKEIRHGDPASAQRNMLRSASRETDRIKPIESVAAAAFASFEIKSASIANLREATKPFEWHYSIEAPGFARVAGDLLLVRPRVIGTKASGLLETKEPRQHTIEFDRPQRDIDVFEIAIPNGYVVEELPPKVSVDEGFVAYQSKTEVVDRKLRYTRTFEIRELSVPAAKAEQLKKLYRTIGNDERNLAVLKRAP